MRATTSAIVVVVGATILAACTPNPIVVSIPTTGAGAWVEPLSMNAEGLVVGATVDPNGYAIGHGATYDIHTGTVTALPDPPASPDFSVIG